MKERVTVTLSRRHFVQLAGASLVLQSQLLKAQQPSAASLPADRPISGHSKVALIHGDDRRKNVSEALLKIDDQLRAGLRNKKYIVIKPNNVSTVNPLAATNADALNGILDYLEPRFRGLVVIAESSAGDSLEGFESFKYNQLVSERKAQKVSLVDLNREGKYETISLLDSDLHITPTRLAARLLDPNAFVISSAMLKTHNTVIATMSVKNMVLGAPLHSAPGELRWNDKRNYHVGVRQTHYNMLVTAQKLQPNWGAAVIDGFEGMEGNGPTQGTAVSSHVAIASTDYIAADRIGLEVMGINPDWVGYLDYCGREGLGQYDLSKIDVLGSSIASVQKKYQLHKDIGRELKWMGPMDELPQKLGSLNHDALNFIYG
jgi:uncharacterized protein (DUF362 family)